MKLRCDNCGETFRDEGELAHVLPEVPDLGSRLDPGGIVPNGTCPECGSLVYTTRQPQILGGNDGSAPEGTAGEPESEFLVEWVIDIHAASFRQAAERALCIQRKRDSIAIVFDVTNSATGVRRTVDLCEENRDSGRLRCRLCGDRVCVARLRDHLCLHNPNADNMDWESVRNMFDLAEPDIEDRIVVAVHGGVAEVIACPEGVVIEVRDYDTEGCDPDQLAEDGGIVNVVTGPIPDWIDDFTAGAAEELAVDGFTEAEALAIASEAADIIREHEAREAGKEVS